MAVRITAALTSRRLLKMGRAYDGAGIKKERLLDRYAVTVDCLPF